MNKLILFGLVSIFTLTACSKEEDDDIIGPCDTEFYEPEWTASLSESSLEGNWQLVEIRYIKLKDLSAEANETLTPNKNVVFLSGNMGIIDQEESFSWNLEPYESYYRWLRFENFNNIFPDGMEVNFETDGQILAKVNDAFMEADEQKELVLEITKNTDPDIHETARLYFRKNE